MEFMVAALMREAPRLGVERVSLNFAVFRAVFEEGARIGAGPVLRLWRHTLLFFSRWWQLESLYRANAKYQPHWSPRYLCFAERRELARVGWPRRSPRASSPLPGSPAHAAARAGPLPGGRGAATSRRPPPRSSRSPPVGPAGARLPEQIRVRLAKLRPAAGRRRRPVPGGLPAHRRAARRCAARHAGLAAGAPHRRDGRRGRPGDAAARPRRACCFATIRDWSGDLQVMLDAGSTAAWTGWRSDGGHRRPRRGDRRGVHHPARRADGAGADPGGSPPSACARCRTSTAAWPTRRPGSGSATWTWSPARRPGTCCGPAARRCTACASRWSSGGYLEVETPILQRVHGGANARPFTTHINAYDLRAVPADRAGAVPQAARGRRGRAGLRDRPGVPQRGRGLHAQPRVHGAGGVPGVRRLRHDAASWPGS